MSNELIIVVAILAIVAIAALVFWATRQRESKKLRERFGPEYERTVEHTRDKHQAESELRARQERVEALEIRPLEPAARDRYAQRWREIQATFVDDPGGAVEQADTLIGAVLRARGYPVGDFEQRAADISVNHPHVVDHYRTAHAIAVKHRSGEGATEQLRQAFVHYRALFADLLEIPGTSGEAATAAPETRSPETRTPDAERATGASTTGQQSRLARRPARGDEPVASTPDTGSDAEVAEPADTARRSR